MTAAQREVTCRAPTATLSTIPGSCARVDGGGKPTATNATTRTRQRETRAVTQRASFGRKDVWRRSQAKRQPQAMVGGAGCRAGPAAKTATARKFRATSPRSADHHPLPSHWSGFSSFSQCDPQALISFLMINVVICVAWGVRLPSRLAESSSVRQTKTSLLPQAVCTFALCALSSKNVDGLNTLGLGESSRETFVTFAKCSLANRIVPISCVWHRRSAIPALPHRGSDEHVPISCRRLDRPLLRHLLRHRAHARVQDCEAPGRSCALAPLTRGWAGTDWVCSLQRLPARPRPAPK